MKDITKCNQCGGFYENTFEGLESHIYGPNNEQHNIYIDAVTGKDYKEKPWWKFW